MYLLLTDETNVAHNPTTPFFIYGGIFFPIQNLLELHDVVEHIRASCGYQPEDTLKFDTRARPGHVNFEQNKEAKRLILELCVRLDIKFVVHLIHHGIIQGQEFEQQVTWAADYVISRFNLFLETQDSTGICVMDNLPPDIHYKYLSQKFQIGLNTPMMRLRLSRIKLFATSCVNASHANSVMDIVLGTFRYCINEPANQGAAQQMMRDIFQLLWRREQTSNSLQTDGLIFRPPINEILSSRFQDEYRDLLKRLEGLLI